MPSGMLDEENGYGYHHFGSFQISNRWDSNAELDFLSHWVQDEGTGTRLTRSRFKSSYSEIDSENSSSPLYNQWGDNASNGSSGSQNEENMPHIGGHRKKQNRTAANQRERKRMKSINDAFDNLRQYIPLPEAERTKLSKVDTLKYAIMYIGNMTEILQQYEDTLYYRKKKHSEAPKRVIVKSKNGFPEKGSELSHSLSWQRKGNDISMAQSNKKVQTRLWVPSMPTTEDMKFLTDPEPLDYLDIPESYAYM